MIKQLNSLQVGNLHQLADIFRNMATLCGEAAQQGVISAENETMLAEQLAHATNGLYATFAQQPGYQPGGQEQK